AVRQSRIAEVLSIDETPGARQNGDRGEVESDGLWNRVASSCRGLGAGAAVRLLGGNDRPYAIGDHQNGKYAQIEYGWLSLIEERVDDSDDERHQRDEKCDPLLLLLQELPEVLCGPHGSLPPSGFARAPGIRR